MTTDPNADEIVAVMSGATGSFGRFLAMEMLHRQNVRLILLVRGEDQESARRRVQGIISEGQDRVEVLRSDLSEPLLGLSRDEYNRISGLATHIVHSAASVRFNRDLDEARKFNVVPTEHMISFAKKCRSLRRFGYIGTALVAGKRSGLIREGEFEHAAGFKNTYEASKYEAEQAVRSSQSVLPMVIFRPPLIITPSVTDVAHVNAMTLGANLVARGILGFLPGTADSTVDVVDGIVAAKAIVDLMFKPRLAYHVYHITNGVYAPRIAQIQRLIAARVGRDVLIDFCGSTEAYEQRVSRIPWYNFAMRHAHRKIASFITELAYPKIYDNSNTLSELGVDRLQDYPLDVIKSALGESTKI